MAEQSWRPGEYLEWQGHTYQIVAFEGLIAEMKDLSTGACEKWNLNELIMETDGRAPAIFAPTLEALEQERERRVSPKLLKAFSLPDNLRQRAQRIITIVERVERGVAKVRSQTLLEDIPFRRVLALRAVIEVLEQDENFAQLFKDEEAKTSKDMRAGNDEKNRLLDQTAYSRYSELHQEHQKVEAKEDQEGEEQTDKGTRSGKDEKKLLLDLSTYYRYRALYADHQGDEAQMAAALRRSDFNQIKASPVLLHLVDTLIMRTKKKRPSKIYNKILDVLERTNHRWIDPAKCGKVIPQNLIEDLLNDKLPMKRILENPENERLLSPEPELPENERPLDPEQKPKEQGLKEPSRGWFYEYYRWFSHQPHGGREVFNARYGKEAWERENLVFDTFATRASTILQYVFVDHLKLPIFLVDQETRKEVHRLWLTVLIDAYSRSVLGFALLAKDPSVESLQRALYIAIWPKESLLRAREIEGEWIAYGIPQMLFMDNAWAHQSYSVESLARKISKGGRYQSIDLILRPPYKGRYGALIERLFGNISGQVREDLPGAFVKTSLQSRQAAREKACLLDEDMVQYILKLIIAYQHTSKDELGGLTPHEKWLEGLQAGYPRVPSLTKDMERNFWHEESDTRIITSKGICAFGMHYQSAELNDAPRVGKDQKDIEYHYAYQLEDISRLAIFLDGLYICDVEATELRRPDGSLQPLSLFAYELTKKAGPFLKKRGRNELVHDNETEALEKTRRAEQRRVQRSQNRQDKTPLQPEKETLPSSVTVHTEDDDTALLASFAKGARSERSIAPSQEK